MSSFGSKADMPIALRDVCFLPLPNVVSDLRRKQQWRQHTKVSVFAEPFMWKFRANRKQWDIAIANHAGHGRVVLSTLSPFGSPTPYGSLRVLNMLPCSKRQNLVSGNTAGNAVAILWPIILRWDWWTYLQRRYQR